MAPTLMTRPILNRLTSISATDVLRIATSMIDPRGRCTRQAMTILTVAFVVVQLLSALLANAIGGDIGVTIFWIINTPVLVIGLVAVVKRLHDIGLSGWCAPAACSFWIAAAFAATLVLTLLVGPDRMATVVAEKGALYWLVFSFVFVPAFGGFIWLHSTPGTVGSNRYGPLPGDDGFGPGHRRGSTPDMPSDAVAAA